MLELRTDDIKQYEVEVRDLARRIEKAQENPELKNELSDTISRTAKILESLCHRRSLTPQNSVIVLSGKSVAVSDALLSEVAQSTGIPDLKTLINKRVQLNDVGNKALYAGKVPPDFQNEINSQKTIIFIDDHGREYNKAVSFLSALEGKTNALFLVFAGQNFGRNPVVTEFANRIIVANNNSGLTQFLSDLSRIESERVRLRQRTDKTAESLGPELSRETWKILDGTLQNAMPVTRKRS